MRAALDGVCPICHTTVPGTQVEPTPQHEKGMFRKRGTTLLDQCIYLMEQMFMESLNGVLCQVDDEHPRACEGCERKWTELKALMARYDAGER